MLRSKPSIGVNSEPFSIGIIADSFSAPSGIALWSSLGDSFITTRDMAYTPCARIYDSNKLIITNFN